LTSKRRTLINAKKGVADTLTMPEPDINNPSAPAAVWSEKAEIHYF